MSNNLLNDGSVNNNEMHKMEAISMKKIFMKANKATNLEINPERAVCIKLFTSDNIENFDLKKFNQAYGCCAIIYKICGEFEVKQKAKLQDIEAQMVEILNDMPFEVATFLGLKYGAIQIKNISYHDVWVDKDTIARGIRKHELSYREILKALFDPDIEMHENSIEKLYFSNGTYNALKRSGINTIEDICKLTDKELIIVPTLGKKGCKEVKEKLNELGRSLKEENILEIPKEKTAEEKILGFLAERKELENKKHEIELEIKKLEVSYKNLQHKIQFVDDIIEKMESKLAQYNDGE